MNCAKAEHPISNQRQNINRGSKLLEVKIMRGGLPNGRTTVHTSPCQVLTHFERSKDGRAKVNLPFDTNHEYTRLPKPLKKLSLRINTVKTSVSNYTDYDCIVLAVRKWPMAMANNDFIHHSVRLSTYHHEY